MVLANQIPDIMEAPDKSSYLPDIYVCLTFSEKFLTFIKLKTMYMCNFFLELAYLSFANLHPQKNYFWNLKLLFLIFV